MKEEALQRENLRSTVSRREDPQIEIESLQIEELQRALRILMQEMLLKHQESDAEVFRVFDPANLALTAYDRHAIGGTCA